MSIFDLANPEGGDIAEPSTKLKAHNGKCVALVLSSFADIGFVRGLHVDAIGSVAFNPVNASMLTVSGSRHFVAPAPLSRSSGNYSVPSGPESGSDPDTSSDSDSSTDRSRSESSGQSYFRRLRHSSRPFVKDASAKVWKFPTEAIEHVKEGL